MSLHLHQLLQLLSKKASHAKKKKKKEKKSDPSLTQQVSLETQDSEKHLEKLPPEVEVE